MTFTMALSILCVELIVLVVLVAVFHDWLKARLGTFRMPGRRVGAPEFVPLAELMIDTQNYLGEQIERLCGSQRESAAVLQPTIESCQAALDQLHRAAATVAAGEEVSVESARELCLISRKMVRALEDAIDAARHFEEQLPSMAEQLVGRDDDTPDEPTEKSRKDHMPNDPLLALGDFDA